MRKLLLILVIGLFACNKDLDEPIDCGCQKVVYKKKRLDADWGVNYKEPTDECEERLVSQTRYQKIQIECNN